MSLVVEGLQHNEIIGVLPENAQGSITFVGKGARLVLGSDIKLESVRIHLDADSVIIIGNKCEIEGTLITDKNCSIFIGESSRLLAATRVFASEERQIKIGKRCVINSARFRTSDSHSVIDLNSQTRINKPQNIVIEEDVFVDRHCYFYKGSHVGAGSYVAIGSIVTRHFANNSYIEGRPASVVKEHVSWQL